jgi:DNA end-binding protein Ku
VKVALRQRERLAMLRAREGVLVLQTLLWPDEVREPKFDFLDQDVSVRPQELQMAESYIAALSADFEPGEFSDDYREALEEVIEAKTAGREVKAPVEAPRSGQVVDLMEALRRSVAEAKSRRGEAGAAAPQKAAKAPAKKSAGKKTAKAVAKKSTAGKKATAKKTATSKRAAARRTA